MALKATIHKVQLQLADLDRNVYGEHSLTIARHPSETDDRMMVRLLAFALNAPANDHEGALVLAKGLSDADEPDLWHKDLTGEIQHWIELGQPDDRRLLKASSLAHRVSVYAYAHSATVWWQALESKIERARNIDVWQIPWQHSAALGLLARRAMQLEITVQEGIAWVHGGDTTVEIHLQRLRPGA